MAFTNSQKRYLSELERCQSLLEEQVDTFENVAAEIYRSFTEHEGVLHVFGSGHSHILSYELFHRAGGLAAVNPIFAEATMPHKGPASVRKAERQEGYATDVFASQTIRNKEVVLIVSNSGINNYPVEFAELCNKAGAVTVAITSLAHSKTSKARGNKKLYEVCQYVLDTGVPAGDSVVPLPQSEANVGPLSTLISVLIGELLIIRVAEIFEDNGKVAPVLKSANTEGGDAFNRHLEEKFATRIPLLKD